MPSFGYGIRTSGTLPTRFPARVFARTRAVRAGETFPNASARVNKKPVPADLFSGDRPWGPLILDALKVKDTYVRDVDYIVRVSAG